MLGSVLVDKHASARGPKNVRSKERAPQQQEKPLLLLEKPLLLLKKPVLLLKKPLQLLGKKYLRDKEQQLRDEKKQLRDEKKQLQDEKKQLQNELSRYKREGDPVLKRAAREEIKTFDIIGKRSDGNFTGFQEVPIDLIEAVESGIEPKQRFRAVSTFSKVENGSTYAPLDSELPMLIAKVDESVRQLIGRLNNGVKADEDAFGCHLRREMSRCFDNLALVGIARSVWEWKDATLATRFADLVHEARAGGKETDLALTLDRLAAGKAKIMEFDAVLVGDDVVVLAELKSTLNPDDVRKFANKVALIRYYTDLGNIDYAVFRGKSILPIVYGGFLGGPETRSRVVEIARDCGLLLYSRSGLGLNELMAEPLPQDFKAQSEGTRAVRCDFIEQFLLEPKP